MNPILLCHHDGVSQGAPRYPAMPRGITGYPERLVIAPRMLYLLETDFTSLDDSE